MPKKKGLIGPLFGLVSSLFIKFGGFSVSQIGGWTGVRASNTSSSKLKLKGMQGNLCPLVRTTAIVGAVGLRKCIS